ncbi:hypothetical protein SAMN04515671_2432 [Nakamurella panacisegetis]|uniref:DUF6779 domain-containing protein n=2 Tax=Nakamurella panacisegetis TaxID=1090615 RepID=A0A1H0NP39_9ACTN|nr:hypothetical protein SAMN04515671_2432 [Nakamurella panacisegetis]
MATRLVLGSGFVLAIVATLLVVLTDQVRWLRLAVVLGLWSALFAGLAMVWFRRDARSAELRAEDSKRTYELELHREISARREYEIGVAEAAREEAEARHREELAGLREQLDRLNTTLSGLLDGDLLFERLTLSAESTRVRQVGESGRGRLTAMARSGQIEGSAEPTGPYIGRPSGPPSAAPGFGGYPVRDDDTVQFPRGLFGPGSQPPVPEAPAPVAPPVAEPVVAEPVVAEQPAVEPPASEAEAELAPQPAPEPEPEPEAEVQPEPEPEPEAEVQPEAEAQPEAEVQPEPEAEVQPEPEAEVQPEPEAEVQPEPEPEAEVQPEPEPEPEAELQPESEPQAEAQPEPRPEAGWSLESGPEPQTEEESAPPEHALAGTGHSAGISVADLLAAYGASEATPRRRRRAED